MKSKEDITYIVLSRDDEDERLLRELEEISASIRQQQGIGPLEFIKQYPMITDLRQCLRRDIDLNQL